MEEFTKEEIQEILELASTMAELLNEARFHNLPYELAKKIDRVLLDAQRF